VPAIGLIILAAGGSTRLGTAKQLLKYGGKTFIRHAAETALATPFRPVIAVLGAEAARVKEELAGLDVLIAENPAWPSGMGSSIRAGMTLLPDVDAVLLTLCDQPLIQPAHLEMLAGAYIEGQPCSIAASSYQGAVGVPALFSRAHFEELSALADGEGAKRLLAKHASRLITVPLSAAAIDVDTRQQYEALPEQTKDQG
jgi:CTP:molybdopterin cytidylyltransferase MocA